MRLRWRRTHPKTPLHELYRQRRLRVEATEKAGNDMAENNINQRIEDFKRTELETLLNQCTDPQREMFEIGYPDGVPESKLITAIQLCERTVAKNDRKRKEMK